ncbi:MAG: nucleoside monophosphate kinase [Candidatus Marinimicrobia bacterium]|nr:nucleoside monophosphate kinase [Candidatus Neomarinimicrobiota bacterium]
MSIKKIIFLIGPPGAGKDTQINYLVEETGFYKFITGDEGLKYISAHMDDPETAKQKENYDSGLLYDPEWLTEKVQLGRTKEVLEGDEYKGLIFSGSPRTLYEAKELPKALSKIVGEENIITVVIEVSEEELRKRAQERLVCENDQNHTFSTRFTDLEIGDKCLKCGGVLGEKSLDKELDTRIRQYVERTQPGIDYLKENGKVVSVDGNLLPEEVRGEIKKALKKENFI